MTVQSFTGRVNTTGEYVEIESIATDFTFTVGNDYTIQVQNDAYIKILDAEFYVANEKFNYHAGNNDLYIKTDYRDCVLTILEAEDE